MKSKLIVALSVLTLLVGAGIAQTSLVSATGGNHHQEPQTCEQDQFRSHKDKDECDKPKWDCTNSKYARYHQDECGNCEQPSYAAKNEVECIPPVDVCVNIEGAQTTVPEGKVQGQDNTCVDKEPETPVVPEQPVVVPTPVVEAAPVVEFVELAPLSDSEGK